MPDSRARDNRLGILWMLLATIAFMGNDAMIKSMGQRLPAAQMIVVRGVMAMALIAFVAWRMGVMGRIADIARGTYFDLAGPLRHQAFSGLGNHHAGLGGRAVHDIGKYVATLGELPRCIIDAGHDEYAVHWAAQLQFGLATIGMFQGFDQVCLLFIDHLGLYAL